MPTQLSPLEEALFQSWARAQGVDNHNDPKNVFDHRALYKNTHGMIQPPGAVKSMADAHNAAANQKPEGGNVTNPDPYMAAAEMHGNQLKAQGDKAKLDAQAQLEETKHKHKMELESMKLHHKTKEKMVDHQVKANEAEKSRIQAAHDAEQARAQQAQDAQANRQHEIQTNQMSQQHGVQEKLLNEQLTRSRPQPAPTQGAPVGHPAAPPASPLHAQLMQRFGQ